LFARRLSNIRGKADAAVVQKLQARLEAQWHCSGKGC